MAQLATVEHLEPARRVADAWSEVRRLRALRHEIEQDLIAAEAILDAERRREDSGFSPLLTVQQVARRLGVSQNTVYSLIRTGQINATKLGGSTRVSEEDLGRYVGGSR